MSDDDSQVEHGKVVISQVFRDVSRWLGLQSSPVAISFSSIPASNGRNLKQTVCTAIEKAAHKGMVINLQKETCVCPGGAHFLGFKRASEEEVLNVYVEEEHVFCSEEVARSFLKRIPKLSEDKTSKYIVFSPLEKAEFIPDLILFVCNPQQANKIIGLSVYCQYNACQLHPSASSTCSAILFPAVTGQLHVNLIDYYTRELQAPDFKPWELIISMPWQRLLNMLPHLSESPFGTLKERIRPREVEYC